MITVSANTMVWINAAPAIFVLSCFAAFAIYVFTSPLRRKLNVSHRTPVMESHALQSDEL